MTKPDPTREKIEELILQVDDVIAGLKAEPEIVESVTELRDALLAVVNPEAPGWGVWEYELTPHNVVGRPEDFQHVVRIPHTEDELLLEVSFYKGQMDGKPVIQIDGMGDFRVNINDSPIWDQSTEQPFTGTNAAE